MIKRNLDRPQVNWVHGMLSRNTAYNETEGCIYYNRTNNIVIKGGRLFFSVREKINKKYYRDALI